MSCLKITDKSIANFFKSEKYLLHINKNVIILRKFNEKDIKHHHLLHHHPHVRQILFYAFYAFLVLSASLILAVLAADEKEVIVDRGEQVVSVMLELD